MPRKFICNVAKEDLIKAYIDEHRTLEEMCPIIGVKNTITASRILRDLGISTNVNARKAEKSRHGMSDEKFKEYLQNEYQSGKSAASIGRSLGITSSGVFKYFKKYGIETRHREPKVNDEKAEIVPLYDKLNMTESELGAYLRYEYESGYSIIDIARQHSVSPATIRKYMERYHITCCKNTECLETFGANNPNWKGGRRVKNDGYVEIYCPDHPNANARKTVYEHQLVMERHIRRHIKKGEVIHHIDGNKSNNDISNLLLLTNSEHIRLHAILKKSADRMEGKII